MNIRYYFLVLCVIFLSSMILYCQSFEINDGQGYFIAKNDPCTADFSYSVIRKTSDVVMIKFRSEMSDSSARYRWEFGDGALSRDKDPVHTFDITKVKDFAVTLNVSVGSCTDEKRQYLNFSEKGCSAEFTWEIVEQDRKSVAVKFQVTQASPSAEYKWSFGDRKGSRKQDPVHTYKIKGKSEFTVVLQVKDGECEKESEQILRLGESVPDEPQDTCSPDFTYKIIFNDEKSGIVQFSSSMDNADSYSWDFGDRSSSRDRNPVHSYEFKGKFQFTVTLEVRKGNCKDKKTDVIIFPEVHVEEKPVCSAEFSYEIASVVFGQAIVNFKSSMADADHYEWTFGDDKLSAEKDPVHVFSTLKKNTYEVTLRVKKGKCKDEKKQTIVFEVIEPDTCSGDFSFEIKRSQGTGGQVQFTSTMNDADSYSWNFGDGKKSTEMNPLHVYDISKLRSFTVSLEVKKGTCTDTISKEVLFPGEPAKECTAAFSFEVVRQDKTKAVVQFVSDFSKTSAQYFWNFGDSTSSTKLNPVHTYRITGTQQFKVTLEVVDGNCSDTQTIPINLAKGTCTAQFTVNVTYNDGERARVEIMCSDDAYAEYTCNFGDGTVSKEWNPVHTYNISRKQKFIITLRVRKGDCDDQIEQEIRF